MPEDTFFTQENCDRCGKKLSVRTMSWFTTETICSYCSDNEYKLKMALCAMGDKKSYEGCGYIPKI